MGWGNVKSFFSNPVSFLTNPKSISVTGILPWNDPTVSKLFASRAKARQDQNADKAAWNAILTQNQSLAAKEMNKYETGKLTKGQQAGIDKKIGIEEAQLRQAMGSMGLSDSSMKVGEEANVQTDKVGMINKIREQHWNNAMRVLGFTKSAMDVIHQTNVENRQENIQIYAGLMGLLGGAAGQWSSGNTTSKSPVDSGMQSDDVSFVGSDMA